MPSQTDLDQGGTNRQWVNQYLGPTIGWVRTPVRNAYANSATNATVINAAGTYTLDLATNFVQVAVAGAVTLILPSAVPTPVGVTGAQPGLSVRAPVTIMDVGGFAAAHPITIQPVSVAETIMGLTQIQITSNYGGFILQPASRVPGWVNAQ